MNWLWDRMLAIPKGCVVWQGSLNQDGYGHVWDPRCKRVRRTHIVAYEDRFGLVPKGLELDHTCRNRACSLHLEAVTHLRNVQRGLEATKTHCKNGHPFNKENTYVLRRGQQKRRICRACRAARMRKYTKRNT